eukprot:m.402945 g.402945  ORF g.402945 m.402945 type:complete len:1846 (-) comp56458_c0_seq1:84-5621(-)
MSEQTTGRVSALLGARAPRAGAPLLDRTALTTPAPAPVLGVRITSELLERVAGQPSPAITDITLSFPPTYGKIKRIENLEGLTRLKSLSLRNNAIRKLEHLETLSGLHELNVAQNQIERLEGIETLIQLHTLNLESNLLTSLGPAIKRLVNLRSLRLADNNIADLAEIEKLKGMRNLAHLTFAGNPCQQTAHYRSFILYHLRTLETLDGQEVQASDYEEAIRRFDQEELQRRDTQLLELRRELELAAAEANRYFQESQEFRLKWQQTDFERTQWQRDFQSLKQKGELQSDLLRTKTDEVLRLSQRLLQVEQELAFLKIDRAGTTTSRASITPDVNHSRRDLEQQIAEAEAELEHLRNAEALVFERLQSFGEMAERLQQPTKDQPQTQDAAKLALDIATLTNMLRSATSSERALVIKDLIEQKQRLLEEQRSHQEIRERTDIDRDPPGESIAHPEDLEALKSQQAHYRNRIVALEARIAALRAQLGHAEPQATDRLELERPQDKPLTTPSDAEALAAERTQALQAENRKLHTLVRQLQDSADITRHTSDNTELLTQQLRARLQEIAELQRQLDAAQSQAELLEAKFQAVFIENGELRAHTAQSTYEKQHIAQLLHESVQKLHVFAADMAVACSPFMSVSQLALTPTDILESISQCEELFGLFSNAAHQERQLLQDQRRNDLQKFEREGTARERLVHKSEEQSRHGRSEAEAKVRELAKQNQALEHSLEEKTQNLATTLRNTEEQISILKCTMEIHQRSAANAQSQLQAEIQRLQSDLTARQSLSSQLQAEKESLQTRLDSQQARLLQVEQARDHVAQQLEMAERAMQSSKSLPSRHPAAADADRVKLHQLQSQVQDLATENSSLKELIASKDQLLNIRSTRLQGLSRRPGDHEPASVGEAKLGAKQSLASARARTPRTEHEHSALQESRESPASMLSTPASTGNRALVEHQRKSKVFAATDEQRKPLSSRDFSQVSDSTLVQGEEADESERVALLEEIQALRLALEDAEGMHGGSTPLDHLSGVLEAQNREISSLQQLLTRFHMKGSSSGGQFVQDESTRAFVAEANQGVHINSLLLEVRHLLDSVSLQQQEIATLREVLLEEDNSWRLSQGRRQLGGSLELSADEKRRLASLLRLEAQHKALERAHEELVELNQAVANRYHSCQKLLETRQQQLSEVETAVSALYAARDKATEELREKAEYLQRITQEIQQAERKALELGEYLNSRSTESQRLATELDRASTALATVNVSLNHAVQEQTHLEQNLDSLRASHSQLLGDLEARRQEMARFSAEAESMSLDRRGKLEELSGLERILERLRAEQHQLQAAVSGAEQSLQALKAQIAVADSRSAELTNLIADRSRLLKQLEDQLSANRAQIEMHQRSLSEFKETTQTREKVMHELVGVSKTVTEKQLELQRVEASLTQRQTELTLLTQQLQRCGSERSELIELLGSARDELSRVSVQTSEKRRVLDGSHQQASLEEEIRLKRRELDAVRQTYADLIESTKTLKAQLSSFEQEQLAYQSLMQERSRAENELQELQQLEQTMLGQLQQVQRDLQSAQSSILEQKSLLETDERLRNDKEDLEKNLLAQRAYSNKLMGELNALRQELVDVKASSFAESQRFRSTVRDLKQQLSGGQPQASTISNSTSKPFAVSPATTASQASETLLSLGTETSTPLHSARPPRVMDQSLSTTLDSTLTPSLAARSASHQTLTQLSAISSRPTRPAVERTDTTPSSTQMIASLQERLDGFGQQLQRGATKLKFLHAAGNSGTEVAGAARRAVSAADSQSIAGSSIPASAAASSAASVAGTESSGVSHENGQPSVAAMDRRSKFYQLLQQRRQPP